MGALVIKSWAVKHQPVDENRNYINILGRQGGLVSWILSLMGIDPTTAIKVGAEKIEFSETSLAGINYRLIPLENVCSTYYGYHKPWKTSATIVAVFAFIGLSMGTAVAEGGSQGAAFVTFIVSTVIGAVIAFVYYFLNRTLTLGFVEHSGVPSGIRFKRSMIENIDVNQDQAKLVCDLVQELIETKQKRALRPSAT